MKIVSKKISRDKEIRSILLFLEIFNKEIYNKIIVNKYNDFYNRGLSEILEIYY